MKKTGLMKKIVFVLLLAIVFMPEVNAQGIDDAFGFEENVDDAPEAPINMLVYIGLIAGSYLGIKKLK
ncbi:hypothetical protein [Mesohalobacter halotolerans]|uniref:Uncharacterized protein n=1 Tax=Mesohalobacter halotolerans TaxID=1883405 RepID=A0A4U5TP53_9FLAO|nr:hypothetical protein [Mesohalobacter halotolerans]TKS55850.1 hypothetical protein FCN74_07395 [Mesohalobacter halotolerans]